MQQYLIGDLAKKTQLSTDSIRFYEKKQLIKPSFRADNNYKYYDEDTLKRLIFTLQLIKLKGIAMMICPVAASLIDRVILP